jgi:hypothetical protein
MGKNVSIYAAQARALEKNAAKGVKVRAPRRRGAPGTQAGGAGGRRAS